MALTDTAIRALKAPSKPTKVADEKGLFLLVTPSGGKWWRLKYRFGGKEKLLSLGTYPDVGLKDARARRDEARKLLADSIDPGMHRKLARKTSAEAAGNSFEAVAREWLAKNLPTWAPSHGDKIVRRLERDIFPWLGSRAIADIGAQDLLAAVRRIEARARLETAHRALQNCGQVFRYAIATGRADRNPAADLRGALAPVGQRHMPAITEPAEVGALMRAIDAFTGSLVVQTALRLAPLVFVRPGELRKAKWAEIDLEQCQWNIPAERMKTREPLVVPLSRQAIALLRELQPLTGRGEHVFPGARANGRPMSDAAVNAALRRMGYDTRTEMTGHGFRAMARTIVHERLGFAPEVIEHQLGHRVPDALGAAYNRTKFLEERRTMMQAWADYLDRLKAGAEVVPIRGEVA